MNLKKTECPACKGTSIKQVIYKENFPAILFPIEHKKKDDVDTKTLIANECDICGHIHLDQIDVEFNKNIYSKYYYLYPYGDLESMNAAYRHPFHEIFNKFYSDVSNLSLLEIGCSTSEQLGIFIKKGFNCTGISPGSDENTAPNIIDGFYENKIFSEKFDCIVSRFNLEHVIDLDLFLSKLHEDLKDGGHVFIQVPNVESFLKHGLLNIFAHEHPQYFSTSSLTWLFSRYGFNIDHLEGGINSSSLILVARKKSSVFGIPHQLNRIKENINSIIEIIKNGNQENKYIFYGAGLSLTGLIYLDGRLSEYEDLISIADDNPALTGKYMPNTNIMIGQFHHNDRADSVVIFLLLNPVYQKQVMEKILSIKPKAAYAIGALGISKLV